MLALETVFCSGTDPKNYLKHILECLFERRGANLSNIKLINEKKNFEKRPILVIKFDRSLKTLKEILLEIGFIKEIKTT